MSGSTGQQVDRLSQDLAALAEPHRLLVLRHLRRGPRTLGFLAKAIGVPQPLASHHLSVLLEAGLVSRRRTGRFSCYTADAERVRALCRRLEKLAGASGAVAELASRADDPC
ncbi:MAG: helix-turn-helix domain-containing protein [Actinomycetota bacterium]|nr:helix-turn-helix domain-containing protein [Actinomycetota bacterium]